MKKLSDGQIYALLWAAHAPSQQLYYKGVYEEPRSISTDPRRAVRRPAKFGITSITGCVTRGLMESRGHHMYRLTAAGIDAVQAAGPRIAVLEAEHEHLSREEAIESHQRYHDPDEGGEGRCGGPEKCAFARNGVAYTAPLRAKMKMWIGNLDGVRRGLVISSSKERARKIVRASRAEFDGFWAEQPVVDKTLEPDTLYTRPNNRDQPWAEGRCAL